jgi:hypothetical protein
MIKKPYSQLNMSDEDFEELLDDNEFHIFDFILIFILILQIKNFNLIFRQDADLEILKRELELMKEKKKIVKVEKKNEFVDENDEISIK